ncbi:hypothetical protein BV25DRAFT_1919443 [Artomyces pyxidatus]|uniref:Uncharacterized protein n=1 Tax=Artomyces pyxidatus TaxID=48021 RepID=A0ACB8SQJ5_9AGAM|nr:hypothetical protein BV25DRAFT_1919443 [Artomyces pyxidatus]
MSTAPKDQDTALFFPATLPSRAQQRSHTSSEDHLTIVQAWNTGDGWRWRIMVKPWRFIIAGKDHDYFARWAAAQGRDTDGEKDFLVRDIERAFFLIHPDFWMRQSSVYVINFREFFNADGLGLWPLVTIHEVFNARDEGYSGDGWWDDNSDEENETAEEGQDSEQEQGGLFGFWGVVPDL